MDGLMNGKPYHGLKRTYAKYVSPKVSIDYEDMAKLVRQGIEKGLITPPSRLSDAVQIAKAALETKRTYGKAPCVLCGVTYSKLSTRSMVCTACKNVEVPCKICSKGFVPYRKGKRSTSTCSTKCGVELMKKTKNGSNK